MPVLELTADMIGPRRTRLVLGYIELVMLWPGPKDGDHRARALSAGDAVHFQEAIAARADEPILLSGKDWAASLRRVAEAPRIADLQPEVQRRFRYGMLAGFIFMEAIADRRLIGERRGLQVVKRSVADRFKGQDGFEDLSIGKIENTVWGPYRGVAHFWAAWLCSPDGAKGKFPCALNEVDQFLGLAEKLRLEARSTEARQAGPIQDPKTTWIMPGEVQLPPV